mmetsp:Transcript_29029/g.66469  ORF Transcript_29029/g.66469 Transcript_29029/m.66469 type:complete len:223 (+) Transcript_29029:125-793(+)
MHHEHCTKNESHCTAADDTHSFSALDAFSNGTTNVHISMIKIKTTNRSTTRSPEGSSAPPSPAGVLNHSGRLPPESLLLLLRRLLLRVVQQAIPPFLRLVPPVLRVGNGVVARVQVPDHLGGPLAPRVVQRAGLGVVRPVVTGRQPDHPVADVVAARTHLRLIVHPVVVGDGILVADAVIVLIVRLYDLVDVGLFVFEESVLGGGGDVVHARHPAVPFGRNL